MNLIFENNVRYIGNYEAMVKMRSIELNDVSMHWYSLCIGGLVVESYPPTVQARFQFTANAMTKSCEFNYENKVRYIGNYEAMVKMRSVT